MRESDLYLLFLKIKPSKVTVKEDNFSNLQVLLVKLGTPGPVVGCLFTPRDTESVTGSVTGSNQHKQFTRIITGHRPPPGTQQSIFSHAINIICQRDSKCGNSRVSELDDNSVNYSAHVEHQSSVQSACSSPQSQTWLVRVWSNFLSVC